MAIQRRKTRKVWVGEVPIGGDAPISVQSMTSTKTENFDATFRQIQQLQDAGCEIVRVSIPNEQAAAALAELKKRVRIPIVADIHFNYRLALAALKAGADKIRINPGNIGSLDRIHQVLKAARERRVPIRIGVNSGSLEKDLLEKYGFPCPEALVESALRHLEICEDIGFEDVVISIKSSHVPTMIRSYELLSQKIDYPLHLGVTEAGLKEKGSIKSAIGIGALLWQGIGDTIRVSLTDDPVEEVKVGFEILKALGLRRYGVEIISCPTCGRIEVDLIKIAREVEEKLAAVRKNIKISLLGCAVNGPGEAREADIGIACGKHAALVYRNGEVIGKIKEKEIAAYLLEAVQNWPEGE